MTDRVLIEFDKAGAEWVVVAYASGDARMIDVVETGKSPHLITGHLVSRVPVDLISRENSLVEHLTDPIEIEQIRRRHLPDLYEGDYFLPRNMSIRQCGKKSNHGLNYIMGYTEFAEFTGMDQSDCKKIIQYYTHVAYPNLPIWWEAIKRQLRVDRTITNCFGRKRRFLDQWGNDLFKQAVAYLPQSTVVDLVNSGMRDAYQDESISDTWDLLAQVHDSLLWQAPISDWKLAARQCALIGLDYMNRPMEYSGRVFHIGTDMKIGRSWGKMYPVKLTRDIDKLAKDMREAWELINDNANKKAA